MWAECGVDVFQEGRMVGMKFWKSERIQEVLEGSQGQKTDRKQTMPG